MALQRNEPGVLQLGSYPHQCPRSDLLPTGEEPALESHQHGQVIGNTTNLPGSPRYESGPHGSYSSAFPLGAHKEEQRRTHELGSAMQGHSSAVSDPYVRLSQAKCVLLGSVAAGKTSLLNALRYGEPRLAPAGPDGRTIGIEVHSVAVRPDTKLWFYDFGGHDTYHFSQQLFLTQKAIYLIAVDVSIYEKDKVEKTLRHWYNILTSRLVSPVICLLATHIDECQEKEEMYRCCSEMKDMLIRMDAMHKQKLENEKSALKDAVMEEGSDPDMGVRRFQPRTLRQPIERLNLLLKSRPRIFHKVCCISSKTFEGMDQFREDLVSIVGDNESLFPQKDVPQSWIALADAIVSKKEDVPFVTITEFIDMAQKFSIIGDYIQKALIYLQSVGLVLHYQDYRQNSELSKYVFVNPNLLLAIFGLVFNHNYFMDETRFVWKHKSILRLPHYDFVHLRKNLKERGVIGEKLLKCFWDAMGITDEVYQAIVPLLEKFDLCYEIRLKPGEAVVDGRHFLFPYLLNKKKPPEVKFMWSEDLLPNFMQCGVELNFTTPNLPFGFLEKVLVRAHTYVDHCLSWKQGMVAFCDEGQDLVRIESMSDTQGNAILRISARVRVDRSSMARHIILLLVAVTNRVLLHHYPGVVAYWYCLCTHCISKMLMQKFSDVKVDRFPADNIVYTAPGDPLQVRCINCKEKETLALEQVFPSSSEKVNDLKRLMSEPCCRVLKASEPALLKSMNYRDVMNALLRKQLLSIKQAETIGSKPSHEERTQELLSYLPNCDQKAFDVLCLELKQNEETAWLAEEIIVKSAGSNKKNQDENLGSGFLRMSSTGWKGSQSSQGSQGASSVSSGTTWSSYSRSSYGYTGSYIRRPYGSYIQRESAQDYSKRPRINYSIKSGTVPIPDSLPPQTRQSHVETEQNMTQRLGAQDIVTQQPKGHMTNISRGKAQPWDQHSSRLDYHKPQSEDGAESTGKKGKVQTKLANDPDDERSSSSKSNDRDVVMTFPSEIHVMSEGRLDNTQENLGSQIEDSLAYQIIPDIPAMSQEVEVVTSTMTHTNISQEPAAGIPPIEQVLSVSTEGVTTKDKSSILSAESSTTVVKEKTKTSGEAKKKRKKRPKGSKKKRPEKTASVEEMTNSGAIADVLKQHDIKLDDVPNTQTDISAELGNNTSELIKDIDSVTDVSHSRKAPNEQAKTLNQGSSILQLSQESTFPKTIMPRGKPSSMEHVIMSPDAEVNNSPMSYLSFSDEQPKPIESIASQGKDRQVQLHSSYPHSKEESLVTPEQKASNRIATAERPVQLVHLQGKPNTTGTDAVMDNSASKELVPPTRPATRMPTAATGAERDLTGGREMESGGWEKDAKSFAEHLPPGKIVQTRPIPYKNHHPEYSLKTKRIENRVKSTGDIAEKTNGSYKGNDFMRRPQQENMPRNQKDLYRNKARSVADLIGSADLGPQHVLHEMDPIELPSWSMRRSRSSLSLSFRRAKSKSPKPEKKEQERHTWAVPYDWEQHQSCETLNKDGLDTTSQPRHQGSGIIVTSSTSDIHNEPTRMRPVSGPPRVQSQPALHGETRRYSMPRPTRRDSGSPVHHQAPVPTSGPQPLSHKAPSAALRAKRQPPPKEIALPRPRPSGGRINSNNVEKRQMPPGQPPLQPSHFSQRPPIGPYSIKQEATSESLHLPHSETHLERKSSDSSELTDSFHTGKSLSESDFFSDATLQSGASAVTLDSYHTTHSHAPSIGSRALSYTSHVSDRTIESYQSARSHTMSTSDFPDDVTITSDISELTIDSFHTINNDLTHVPDTGSPGNEQDFTMVSQMSDLTMDSFRSLNTADDDDDVTLTSGSSPEPFAIVETPNRKSSEKRPTNKSQIPQGFASQRQMPNNSQNSMIGTSKFPTHPPPPPPSQRHKPPLPHNVIVEENAPPVPPRKDLPRPPPIPSRPPTSSTMPPRPRVTFADDYDINGELKMGAPLGSRVKEAKTVPLTMTDPKSLSKWPPGVQAVSTFTPGAQLPAPIPKDLDQETKERGKKTKKTKSKKKGTKKAKKTLLPYVGSTIPSPEQGNTATRDPNLLQEQSYRESARRSLDEDFNYKARSESDACSNNNPYATSRKEMAHEFVDSVYNEPGRPAPVNTQIYTLHAQQYIQQNMDQRQMRGDTLPSNGAKPHAYVQPYVRDSNIPWPRTGANNNTNNGNFKETHLGNGNGVVLVEEPYLSERGEVNANMAGLIQTGRAPSYLDDQATYFSHEPRTLTVENSQAGFIPRMGRQSPSRADREGRPGDRNSASSQDIPFTTGSSKSREETV